ncbi:hypothetical protein AKJ16_DCAP07032 [Drosera capensis]
MTPKLRSTTMAPTTYAKQEISATAATFEGRYRSKMELQIAAGKMEPLNRLRSRATPWQDAISEPTSVLESHDASSCIFCN